MNSSPVILFKRLSSFRSRLLNNLQYIRLRRNCSYNLHTQLNTASPLLDIIEDGSTSKTSNQENYIRDLHYAFKVAYHEPLKHRTPIVEYIAQTFSLSTNSAEEVYKSVKHMYTHLTALYKIIDFLKEHINWDSVSSYKMEIYLQIILLKRLCYLEHGLGIIKDCGLKHDIITYHKVINVHGNRFNNLIENYDEFRMTIKNSLLALGVSQEFIEREINANLSPVELLKSITVLYLSWRLGDKMTQKFRTLLDRDTCYNGSPCTHSALLDLFLYEANVDKEKFRFHFYGLLLFRVSPIELNDLLNVDLQMFLSSKDPANDLTVKNLVNVNYRILARKVPHLYEMKAVLDFFNMKITDVNTLMPLFSVRAKHLLERCTYLLQTFPYDVICQSENLIPVLSSYYKNQVWNEEVYPSIRKKLLSKAIPPRNISAKTVMKPKKSKFKIRSFLNKELGISKVEINLIKEQLDMYYRADPDILQNNLELLRKSDFSDDVICNSIHLLFVPHEILEKHLNTIGTTHTCQEMLSKGEFGKLAQLMLYRIYKECSAIPQTGA